MAEFQIKTATAQYKKDSLKELEIEIGVPELKGKSNLHEDGIKFYSQSMKFVVEVKGKDQNIRYTLPEREFHGRIVPSECKKMFSDGKVTLTLKKEKEQSWEIRLNEFGIFQN